MARFVARLVRPGHDTRGEYPSQRRVDPGIEAGPAVHSARMDPLDHVPFGLDGVVCAVCGGPVPIGSVQVLAHRDALAFLQVECGACKSTTLAFRLEGDGRDGRGSPPVDPPATSLRSGAVTADDVLDMHVFLRDWGGDVATLFAPAAPEADRP